MFCRIRQHPLLCRRRQAMEYVIFALAAFALVAHLVAAIATLLVSRRPPSQTTQFPSVSILKPLKGIDDRLEENLSSFFQLDYPSYELVFCAPNRREPALRIVEALRSLHPHVRSRVIVGEAGVGLNPKVRVLAHATRFVHGELLVVSDSNVRVTPPYLSETLAEFSDEDVSVVSNLVAGVGERSLGATLENLQLNGFIAPAICLGLVVNLTSPCVVGKSMVIRRSDLESVGGWKSLANVLAEDYLLGQRLGALGRKAVISPHRVETVNEHWSLGRFLERHDRWLKMRWRINPYALLFEKCSNVTFWAVLAAAIAGLAPKALIAAALLVLGRTALDAIVTTNLRHRIPPLYQLALVPLRDMILAVLWFHSRWSSSIRWRGGQRLVVGRLSQLSLPSPADAEASAAPVALPDASAEPLTTAIRR